MEHFEIGSCFQSYSEVVEKLQEYCKVTNTKFTTKDSRLITDEYFATSNNAKEALMYSELKLICVYGRPSPKVFKAKHKIKFIRTECPAYFRLRLINSGVALQIVALNIKHNHPLETLDDDVPVIKKPNRLKHKTIQNLKINTEENVNSDGDTQTTELIEVLIDEDEVSHTNVNFSFRGFCAPVFTPFGDDLSIKVEVIPKYADYLFSKGIKGVLVNSTVGEGTSMSVSERKLVTQEWSKAVKTTRQHLMVQVGGCPLPDVLELSRHAEEIGANSMLCLPELYHRPTSSNDLIDYLKIVGAAAPKTPLLYSHEPTLSGVNLNMAEFLNDVTEEIPTFQGIKYASNDLDAGIEALNVKDGRYVVFLGVDTLMACAFAMGFNSAIAPTLNIYPEYAIDILNAVTESNMSKIKEIQNKLSAVYETIKKHGTLITSMKASMNLMGPINVGRSRPPLKDLTDEQMFNLKQCLVGL